jgi:hypothetical protein
VRHANQLQPARAGIAFEQPGLRLAVNGATLASSRRLASELATLQAHTAHYLAGGPSPDTGRLREHFVDPDRLPLALAGLEVTAIRSLHAQPPSVRDLAGIAHTEQALLTHTIVLISAAARAGVIDPDDFASQIRPWLENAQTGWGDVAASWPADDHARATLPGRRKSQRPAPPSPRRDQPGRQRLATHPDRQREHLVDVAGLLRDAWRQAAVVPNASPSCRLNWRPLGTSAPLLDSWPPRSAIPAGAGPQPKVQRAQPMSPTGGSSPSDPSRPPTPPRLPATWPAN